AFTCNDGNVCTDDACNGTGCTFAPNSAPCDDGNACTSNDTCSGGVCRGGSSSCCSPGPETNCSIGIDDDCDGLIDGADPDCQSACQPYEGFCFNGVDDDCDGLIDFADPDSVLQPCGADECAYGISALEISSATAIAKMALRTTTRAPPIAAVPTARGARLVNIASAVSTALPAIAST